MEHNYIFICDKCGAIFWVDKNVADKTVPKLCNPCFENYMREDNNWKDYEIGE